MENLTLIIKNLLYKLKHLRNVVPGGKLLIYICVLNWRNYTCLKIKKNSARTVTKCRNCKIKLPAGGTGCVFRPMMLMPTALLALAYKKICIHKFYFSNWNGVKHILFTNLSLCVFVFFFLPIKSRSIFFLNFMFKIS